jgi:ribokinase/sulfofructose kinase
MDLSNQRSIDILAVGGIDVDLVLTVPHLPTYDEKVMGELVGHLPGGPAANFACAASRLGLRVASLAQVGDDVGGQFIIEDFKRFGVDTRYITVRPQADSPFTVILIDPTGEKAIVVVPTFKAEYPPELLAQVLPQARILNMMPQDHEQFLYLGQIAHHYGVEVMIDVEATVGAQRAQLERMLTQTDIANFNQEGFSAATGQTPSFEAARELLDHGPHTVIVTRGAGGALVVTRTESAEHPGFKVKPVDTTGAGDTFNAAFLAATLRNEPLAQRLRFANAAAALSVTGMGPRGFLPTRAEVETFLANTDLTGFGNL